MASHWDSNELLPRCDGPKLDPFPGRNQKINFKSLLSDQDAEGQAHVFKVSIGRKMYALKMFKFYNDEEDIAGLDDSETDLVSNELIHAHMDPFYSECRAFGRINDKNLNGKIAVRCYGHLTIPAAKEEELQQAYKIDTWDRPDEDCAKSVDKRLPFRAIVKELLSRDTPLTDKLMRKILRDLKRLRRLGVYPMDVQERNYKDGLLVDLGVAITTPHFLFDIKPKWQVRFFKRDDLIRYDHMAKNAGVSRYGPRALRNREYCAKLRSTHKPATAVKQ